MKIASISSLVGGVIVLALVLFLTLAPPTTPLKHQPSLETPRRVVATVGSRAITLSEVQQAAALPLYQAEAHRTRLLNEATQRLIDETLLSAEATRTGITVPELLERASQSETITRLANLPGPVRTVRQPSQTLTLPVHLLEETARIRQALLVQLRRSTKIHVDLLKPELPVLAVSADDDPWTGTATAPITIIEFSDFECPYCKRSVSVLKELLAQYPGKLKLVYRDFPGPNHQLAQSAAEAAQCAAEQGRFWEYHDVLFTKLASKAEWNFSALAGELGLHQAPFDTCMKDNRYREEVLKDLSDGLTLGVTSTPTFFINGRPLVGAHALADFQAIIDPLLSHATSP